MIYKLPTVEACYLQFRKILELIAFGSIVGNKELYSKQYTDFSKHWNAKRILQGMEKINSEFYPRPIEHNKSSNNISEFEWNEIPENKYLTQSEFIELYNKCGAIMHSVNPYGKKIDTDKYFNDIDYWLAKIFGLLNCHSIVIEGDENHIYLCFGKTKF